MSLISLSRSLGIQSSLVTTSFDAEAIAVDQRLRSLQVRVSTMDLRIAALAEALPP